MSRPLRRDSDWEAAAKVWRDCGKEPNEVRDLLCALGLFGLIEDIVYIVFGATAPCPCNAAFPWAVFLIFAGANLAVSYLFICILTRGVRNPMYAIPVAPCVLAPLALGVQILKGLAWALAQVFGEAGAKG